MEREKVRTAEGELEGVEETKVEEKVPKPTCSTYTLRYRE